MKKIVIGLLQTTLSLFIILFGAYLISGINVSVEAKVFASMMGGLLIIINFIIGCILMIGGYHEVGLIK